MVTTRIPDPQPSVAHKALGRLLSAQTALVVSLAVAAAAAAAAAPPIGSIGATGVVLVALLVPRKR